MTNLWHIREDGTPGKCNKKRFCPLGYENPHFKNKLGAQVYVAKQALEKLDNSVISENGSAVITAEHFKALSKTKTQFNTLAKKYKSGMDFCILLEGFKEDENLGDYIYVYMKSCKLGTGDLDCALKCESLWVRSLAIENNSLTESQVENCLHDVTELIVYTTVKHQVLTDSQLVEVLKHGSLNVHSVAQEVLYKRTH